MSLTFYSGEITDRELLPITRLYFGRTAADTSSGVHTLGKLQCNGQKNINGMPVSCEDLWITGHSLSGIYLLKGASRIETAYCDFNKLPIDQGRFLALHLFLPYRLSDSKVL